MREFRITTQQEVSVTNVYSKPPNTGSSGQRLRRSAQARFASIGTKMTSVSPVPPLPLSQSVSRYLPILRVVDHSPDRQSHENMPIPVLLP